MMSHQVYGIGILLVYVDNTLLVSHSLERIESAKRAIGKQFCMFDFGEAKFILGMDILMDTNAGTMSFSQERYTKELVEKHGMLDSTPSKLPMAPTHYKDGEVTSDENKVSMSPS
jgi:hypothetical protein